MTIASFLSLECEVVDKTLLSTPIYCYNKPPTHSHLLLLRRKWPVVPNTILFTNIFFPPNQRPRPLIKIPPPAPPSLLHFLHFPSFRNDIPSNLLRLPHTLPTLPRCATMIPSSWCNCFSKSLATSTQFPPAFLSTAHPLLPQPCSTPQLG